MKMSNSLLAFGVGGHVFNSVIFFTSSPDLVFVLVCLEGLVIFVIAQYVKRKQHEKETSSD